MGRQELLSQVSTPLPYIDGFEVVKLRLVECIQRSDEYFSTTYVDTAATPGTADTYELIYDGAAAREGRGLLFARAILAGEVQWASAFKVQTDDPLAFVNGVTMVRKDHSLAPEALFVNGYGLATSGFQQTLRNLPPTRDRERLEQRVSLETARTKAKVAHQNVPKSRNPKDPFWPWREKQQQRMREIIASLEQEGALTPLERDGKHFIFNPGSMYSRYALLHELSKGMPTPEVEHLEMLMKRNYSFHSRDARFAQRFVRLNADDAKPYWVAAFDGSMAHAIVPQQYYDRVLVVGEAEPSRVRISQRTKAFWDLVNEGTIYPYHVPPKAGVLRLPKGRYCDIARATRWIGSLVSEPIYERASKYHHDRRLHEERGGVPESMRKYVVRNNLALVLSDAFHSVLSPHVRKFVSLEAEPCTPLNEHPGYVDMRSLRFAIAPHDVRVWMKMYFAIKEKNGFTREDALFEQGELVGVRPAAAREWLGRYMREGQIDEILKRAS